MSDDLRDRLQQAVGENYRIDRELGGGGMSRVFLAEDTALTRKVVIKVLPPEMAAGVNVERFRREIQLAASLQHPHIVQLFTAGSSGDLLYYVMPFIEGESLRAKLAREGELPVGEALRILRDVTDALAYAHAHGVVHRDIKPDNVLLSGKHALVADFGVARAVSASSGGSSLTSLGIALGTPAYMAPEQAAADPHIDHRADIYAVGALAYEMLTGRTPFSAPTPQAMLAAHVTEAAPPVTKYRPAVPPSLAAAIGRCLEKKPADRWQKAEELVAQLEALATPSGGMTPIGTAPFPADSLEIARRRGNPLRVGGIYLAAAAAVWGAVFALSRVVGFPDWVLPGTAVLLVLGLPIMIATGLIERRRAIAKTTGTYTSGGQPGLQRWFTWKRAVAGGGAAFGVLALVAIVYMAMRVLGIGPVGTVIASGALKSQDPLILVGFENRAGDSTLGPSLTEAFRVDLSQSRSVRLLDPTAIGDALQRMQRPATTTVDLPLAREIAQREGVKGIVTGQIDPVGKSYVLSASVVSAADGRTLAAVRQNAADDAALIGAIDKLSRALRERIGESLASIRANEPLAHVTTGSLDALRSYSQALTAVDRDGDYERGIVLLRDATSTDSGFAMAWRKLSVYLANIGAPLEQRVAATSRAYAYRDRLPDLERYLVTAQYYFDVEYDPARIEAAYRSALEQDPTNDIALNNLALALNNQRRWAEAESLGVRAASLLMGDPEAATAVTSLVAQGRFAEGSAIVERLAAAGPGHLPAARRLRALIAAARFDYRAAAEQSRLLQTESARLSNRQLGALLQSAAAEAQGKLGEAALRDQDFMAMAEQRGIPSAYLGGAAALAWIEVRYRNRPAEALRILETALVKHPLGSMAALDRPYAQLAEIYAAAGRTDRAKQLLGDFATTVPEGIRRENPIPYAVIGAIAMTEGRLPDAVIAYRARYDRDTRGCVSCGWFELAQAYDRMGGSHSDSALAWYEQVVATPGIARLFGDAYRLAPTYKRLGELYEAKGDRVKAKDYYSRFVDLWKDADAELQPQVQDVKRRLARLTGER
ncbi:MAG TPA: protein kinase [Gemmatimonadales bacterium]|nr:protein kinase [Gemmatimonadales bacterium]